jgi:hypothetical protein
MNYSQKAARVFEIVDYILLIPAALGVLVASLMVFSVPLFTLVIWTIAGFGVALLIGYCRHSRGRLSERKVSMLWFGTIFYNSIPMMFAAYFVYKYFTSAYEAISYEHIEPLWWLVWGTLAAWWTTAVFVPANALYQNYKANQKYL